MSGRHRGRVVLVGAGPGNPGLLTLRGAEVLAEADAVLYDELASPELLALAPPGAERINVGKRGHELPTRSQAEVQELMLERARAGQTVVRLKGGDPFVFGRGGEEISACRDAGIAFEVVPGVSSPVGGLAYAGIPLTDRRHAASFAVVTGHKDPTAVSEATRWAELGRAVDTLVILMGMRNLPELVRRILESGKDPETPAAAVMDATLPTQRLVEAPLAKLPEAVAAAGLRAPALVVIGDVVGLRSELGWWERGALFGWTVLVTRAADQADAMVGALRAAGARPLHVPLIGFGPPEPEEAARLEAALHELDEYDAIVFASANAVRFTLEAACRAGVDLRGGRARTACVGPATAAALLEAGLPVHCAASGAAGGGAEALLAELTRAVPPAGRRFLVPRSQLGRDTLVAGLRAAGAHVDALTAYRTLRPEVDAAALRDRLRTGVLRALTFTSPSAVSHFVELLDDEARAAAGRCIVAAVGGTTARALRDAGLPPDVVPERPDTGLLVRALVRHVEAARHRDGDGDGDGQGRPKEG